MCHSDFGTQKKGTDKSVPFYRLSDLIIFWPLGASWCLDHNVYPSNHIHAT